MQPETVRLYELALADVADATLERAAVECLRECTFWPTVAEVRSKCEQKRGMTVQEAEAAILAEHPEWVTPQGIEAHRRELERRRRARIAAEKRPMLEPGALATA